MVDPTADRAVFRQLADHLRARILSGELAPGSALPSELRLSQEYDLSRTSVRQAIALLRAEGLVEVDRPKGTFVRMRPDVSKVKLAAGDSVTTRMPTPDERRQLDIPEGVPILVVTHADGNEELYAGDRTQVSR